MGQFDVAADIQFAEHAVTVTVHRFRAETQLLRDLIHFLPLVIISMICNSRSDRQLNGVSAGLQLTQGHLLGDIRRDIALPRMHGAQGVNHFLRRGALAQITGGPACITFAGNGFSVWIVNMMTLTSGA